MKKIDRKKLLIIIILSVVVLAIAVFCAFQFDLGTRLWYVLPSFKDYYVYIPTNLTAEEAKETTITLKNVTGFNKDPIVAEYWEESSCFHAVLSKRGIYEIYMNAPQTRARTEYVEIGHEEIYCIAFNVGSKASTEEANMEKAHVWNGHSYLVVDYHGTWEEAREYCENLGGHLVTITSQEEQTMIEGLLEAEDYESYWLGGYIEEGSWKWITEESFEFQYWDYDQPDGDSTNMFIQMMASGVWDDTWVDGDHGGGLKEQRLICEWDVLKDKGND